MTIQRDYISSLALQSYMVDKDTGAPLANGYMLCYEDADRTIGKNVFQKVPVNPPEFDEFDNPIYTFVPLGNVVNFSAVGTFMDNSGNDIIVYFYPWDTDGNLQPYYLAIFDSLGVEQFTREGYPDSFETENPNAGGGTSENQITNPQFALVNFNVATGLTITISGAGAETINIAPGWNLFINATGAGTVTVQQIALVPSDGIITNPPYALSVASAGAITQVQLIQTFQQDPALWSATLDAEGNTIGGYVATNVVLAENSPTITVQYVPTGVSAITLLTGNTLAEGIYTELSNTVQLPVSTNTTEAPNGNVAIVINLTPGATTILTSVQIVTSSSDIASSEYVQSSVNRQIDNTFNYFKPKLDFKPIKSYLIGWDFPLNPAQALGYTVTPFASGTKTSNYFFDQTIVFQTANSGVQATITAAGLTITAAATTKLALIQYLDASTLASMLQNNLSSNILGMTNQSGGVPITVSLWGTTNSSLPSISSNTSLVTDLDDNGYPGANVVTGWTEIKRTLIANQNAQFTMVQGTTPADYGFSGWGKNYTAATTYTFFAIVIGTGSLTIGNTITLTSASLVAGDIPTRPAAQSQTEVLLECQRFYWKTFGSGIVPASPPASGGVANAIAYIASGSDSGDGVYVQFPTAMYKTPAFAFYNPVVNGATWQNVGFGVSGAASIAPRTGSAPNTMIGPQSATIYNTETDSDNAGNTIAIHATFDARLGT